MNPKVRQLYMTILTIGKDYPKGLGYVRDRAKREFRQHADAEGPALSKALAYGRWMSKEMIGVIQLSKYRQLK